MHSVAPSITDLVSDILVLAGTKASKGIPRSAIHSILREMQAEEPLLSVIRFSITGDVCFSRDIDTAINGLLVRGTLRMLEDGAVLVNNIPTLRTLKNAIHTRSRFYDLLNASRNFYRRFDAWTRTAEREMLREQATP